MKIVLLTWLCGPWTHVANWVVLGSFIPLLCSGTLIFLLFGLKDFNNSDSRFSQLFLPESPRSGRSPASSEDSEDIPRYFSETLVLTAFAIHCHRYIPMGICMHLSFSWSFIVALVVTRCLKIFVVVPRILWVYCLAVLFCMKNLMGFFSHLSRIRSSQLFMCLT